METLKTSNSQTISRKKNRAGGIILPDFKHYDKAIVNKTGMVQAQKRHT